MLLIEFVWCERDTAGHTRTQGKVGGESKWVSGEKIGDGERAYKVRFQVGALIQDLYRLLRRKMVAGVVLFSLEVVV